MSLRVGRGRNNASRQERIYNYISTSKQELLAIRTVVIRVPDCVSLHCRVWSRGAQQFQPRQT